jgi:hypothetical protein
MNSTPLGPQYLPAAAPPTPTPIEPSVDLLGEFHRIAMPTCAFGKWQYGGWIPGNGAIQTSNLIVANHVGTGTLTTVDSTLTNYRTRFKRNVLTSAASAGSVAHVRTASFNASVHGGTDLTTYFGGYFYKYILPIESSITGCRQFAGLRNLATTPTTGTEPSSFVNCVILGWDSGDTNMQIMHNDASGTCTKIDLGASFPANTANTVYEFYLFQQAGNSNLYYEVVRVDVSARPVASGVLNSNLPISNVFLVPHHYGDNGPTAVAIPLNIVQLSIWWQTRNS